MAQSGWKAFGEFMRRGALGAAQGATGEQYLTNYLETTDPNSKTNRELALKEQSGMQEGTANILQYLQDLKDNSKNRDEAMADYQTIMPILMETYGIKDQGKFDKVFNSYFPESPVNKKQGIGGAEGLGKSFMKYQKGMSDSLAGAVPFVAGGINNFIKGAGANIPEYPNIPIQQQGQLLKELFNPITAGQFYVDKAKSAFNKWRNK